MSELVSLYVRLFPESDGVLDIFPGRLLHAALLHFVQEISQPLSERLHAPSGDKPFTVSSLLELPGREASEIHLHKGEEVAFRVTSLDPDLSRLLLETLGNSEGAAWQLGKVPCRIAQVETEGHTWARCEDYGELYQRILERVNQAPQRIRLRFITPTTFRQAHGNLPLPLPGLVFRNYLAKWKRHTGLDFAPELESVLAEQVLIERYRLQTRMLPFGRGRMEVGFTGECTYRLKAPNPAHRLLLLLLADYAYYCGTGAKTTQGMGQTCRLEAR